MTKAALRLTPPSNLVDHEPYPNRRMHVFDPDKPGGLNPMSMLALPDNMTAFIDEDNHSMTRKELFNRGFIIAEVLKSELGIEEGDALLMADVELTHQPEWLLAVQLARAVPVMLGDTIDPAMLMRTERMHIKGILVRSDSRYQQVLEMMERGWAESRERFDMTRPPLKPPIVVAKSVESAMDSFGSWGSVHEVVSPSPAAAVWQVRTQEHDEDLADS